MVLVDTSIIIDYLNRNVYKESIKTLLYNKEFSTTEIIINKWLRLDQNREYCF